MSDLQELNIALAYNALAIRHYTGNITGYIDLLTQRNNILTMILQVTQELNQSRKAA